MDKRGRVGLHFDEFVREKREDRGACLQRAIKKRAGSRFNLPL
jgi:hypothetical protein